MNGFGVLERELTAVDSLECYVYPEVCPVSKYGKLRISRNVKGFRCLCSEWGEEVQLRGMSSHGLQWAGSSCVTAENIKFLASAWSCSVFRIVVYVDEEGGFFCNRTHLTRYVDNAVKWCAEAGIYCLIDWHVHNPGNPQDEKYRNHPLSGVDLAASFFTYCAKRYCRQKHVLYELCNEPNSRGEVHDVTWNSNIKPYCEEMLSIIRKYDSAVCVCGSADWSKRLYEIVGNEPVDANGVKYENVMYTFHFYAASHNNGKDVLSEDETDFISMFRGGNGIVSILEKLPVFVTEWGTTDCSGWHGFCRKWSNEWLEILAGQNSAAQVVSWCNWSFSAEGGECAALKWNDGNLSLHNGQILTGSGRYVVDKLLSNNM